MPKESTHLFLAGRIKERIQKDPGLENVSILIEKAPHLFAMGAVAPDSIYNYISGPAKEFFKKNVENSHGGGDSGLFDYMKRFAEQELPFVSGLSFGLGILCHLTADMIFHPMVYYFCGPDVTGKVSDATIRHFYFESELDRTIRWIFPEMKKERLNIHLRNKEMDDRSFALALEALHISEDAAGLVPPKEFISMYRQHARFESFYGKNFFKHLGRAINKLTGGGKPDFPALFYADIPGKAETEEAGCILRKKISFKNPVTGAVLEKNLSEMIGEFISLYIDYLRPVEKCLDSRSWDEVMPAVESWQPRSPKSGLPMERHGEMRFSDFKTLGELLGRA